MFGKFRQLDFFEKVQSDIDTSSTSGGIYSLCALFIGVFLFMNEVGNFYKEEITTKMYIDQERFSIMPVNMQIKLFEIPCALVSVDVIDDMNNQTLNIKDGVFKLRSFQNRSVYLYNETVEQPKFNIDQLISELKEKQGCELLINLRLKKIPGMIQISAANNQNYQLLMRRDFQLAQSIKFDYTLNYLQFGSYGYADPKDRVNNPYTQNMQKFFTYQGIKVSPYNMRNQTANEPAIFLNYLNLLPIQYQINDKISTQLQLYTYSMNQGWVYAQSNNPQRILFKYQIQPIHLLYSRQNKPYYKLIVSILAIVGGIFASMGILNSYTLSLMNQIKKK